MIIYLKEKKNIEKSQKIANFKGIKGIPQVKTPLRTHIWRRFKKRYCSDIKTRDSKRKNNKTKK
jgi:hypothetical protein